MIRGLWDRETVALMLLVAMIPVAVTWLLAEGWGGLARLVIILAVAGLWHVVFMLARAQPPSFAGALTALAVAILAPVDLGPLQMLLAISFGVVMGELVFGGWGRNLLNPATVVLAFLGFGFPAAPWPDLPMQLGWATLPAALIGLGAGVISGRILLGAVAVLLLALPLGLDLTTLHSAVLLTLVLLVCDPVASAATGLGRWLNGALYGALVLMFAGFWSGAAPVQIAVAAALLASLAAPLLDELALAIWHSGRRRRFG